MSLAFSPSHPLKFTLKSMGPFKGCFIQIFYNDIKCKGKLQFWELGFCCSIFRCDLYTTQWQCCVGTSQYIHVASWSQYRLSVNSLYMIYINIPDQTNHSLEFIRVVRQFLFNLHEDLHLKQRTIPDQRYFSNTLYLFCTNLQYRHIRII